MAKSKSLSRSPVRLRTYHELDQFIVGFAENRFNLMILLGGPGLGKSQRLKAAIGGRACVIEGHATAFGMYRRLYEHRDQLVLIDDVDELYRDRGAIRLLKTLCQSDPTKTIAWNSAAKQLEKLEIPRAFYTTSKVAIVANDWQQLNLDIAALEDRGHVIEFAPDALEVHRMASTWFSDQEVFDFVGEHLSLISQPSFRHYVAGAELKGARIDWKSMLLSRLLQGSLLIVSQLKADNRYQSEEERARAFKAAGHGCRATYFNHVRKLPPRIEAPKLVLSARKAEHALPPLENLETGSVEPTHQTTDGPLSSDTNLVHASQEPGHEPSPREVGDEAQALSLAP